jgi:flagellar motility protein MotE (MotC chaperone)
VAAGDAHEDCTVSEYQYYEFQAVDRPLTEKEMTTLRGFSSRATITSTRFVNSYSYGRVKGDPSKWIEEYFDAFIYLANWGTRELFLRLPARALPVRVAKAYCAGDVASARAKDCNVLLEIRSDDEGGSGEWIDEEYASLSLASLVPLRADLMGGDLRVLYLSWLLAAQDGQLDDGYTEPPCPPGLRSLSAPLDAFIEFMRLDRDLVEAAAAGSPALEPADDAALGGWVAALSEAEKTSLLVRLVAGGEPHLRTELLRRFRESRPASVSSAAPIPRTVGELLEAAKGKAEERRSREAARAAKAKAREEREAAKARDLRLEALAERQVESWHEVEKLIATKQPRKYDEAVALLQDLREVCVRAGKPGEAASRIARLREEHAKKGTLIERFRKAGLLTP